MNVGGKLWQKMNERSADPLLIYIKTGKPDILGLVETKCLNVLKIPLVRGYKRFYINANCTGGVPSGGILVLIRDTLKYKVINKISQDKEYNTIWLKLQTRKSAELVFGFVCCKILKTNIESGFQDLMKIYLTEFYSFRDILELLS